ncbi:uncharacterized protein GGS25DRAFT_346625 [Hypoxylon fragiforme]|uniref:uncharacterized protein n=1 Tax=Hypoxylon fragiforme TaxID=63214 RepID=UPI0020C6A35A|nr:uncharacterized protein GGS25DRAFT_346625 [Hypoxylon fragiforme]KAI2607684.1 hypothetical protein GGS25DRAFT_346625 [Hypoxylon fragiforme]
MACLYFIVLSTRSLYMVFTSSTSARSSSTSSLFSPSISNVVWYLSLIDATSNSSSSTFFLAPFSASASFINATISPRASSRWLEILASSSLADTFSLSNRRITALILSTSCTDGPAVIVDTDIISCKILCGEAGVSRFSNTSSLSAGCVVGDASISKPPDKDGGVPACADAPGNRGDRIGGCADGRLPDDGRSAGLGSPLLEGAEVFRSLVG